MNQFGNVSVNNLQLDFNEKAENNSKTIIDAVKDVASDISNLRDEFKQTVSADLENSSKIIDCVSNVVSKIDGIENSLKEDSKINLDAPIKSGTSQTILAQAVGHFDESAKWTGNVALAGHNRGYNCNFFQNIKKLKEGDEIIYCTEKGERKYKVTINKIIKQTDWSYIKNTKDNRITLITCVENMYEYRRCIQAMEII